MRPIWAEKKCGVIHSRIYITNSAWHETDPGEYDIYLGIETTKDIGQKSFGIVEPGLKSFQKKKTGLSTGCLRLWHRVCKEGGITTSGATSGRQTVKDA